MIVIHVCGYMFTQERWANEHLRNLEDDGTLGSVYEPYGDGGTYTFDGSMQEARAIFDKIFGSKYKDYEITFKVK